MSFENGQHKAKHSKMYNVFLLAKMIINDSQSFCYAVIEEKSRIVLFTSLGLASALFDLHRFLAPLEQDDLNDILLTMGAEVCNFHATCRQRHKGNGCTNRKKCYQFIR